MDEYQPTMQEYSNKLQLYMKTTISKAKSMYQGFDNFSVPSEYDVSSVLSPMQRNTPERCFRDLCIFEYCVNPLKNITLTEYEQCIKKLAFGSDSISIK